MSFFEKLKKGMGGEINEIEKMEDVKAKVKKETDDEPIIKKIEFSPEEEKKDKKPSLTGDMENKKDWAETTGQLAIDVYQTESDLVIQSAIAGVKSGDINIAVEGDILLIDGKREKPLEEEGDYFTQECYWGRFSRQIILPVETDPGRTEASLKDGVLIIRIPRIQKDKKKRIIVKS